MIKYKIFLTNEEREALSLIIKKGQTKAKKFRNALILLNCDKSEDRNKTITNKLMS